MTPAETARAHELLVQLENSEAFNELIVKPYTEHAAGALRRAIAEAVKPAGPVKQGEPVDPAKIRNPQIVCDCLREHALYNEVATLVSSQLASIRQAAAKREAAGRKDLPETTEPA
jgi:hypothetical protein